jgi:hypothetical protein
MNTTITIAALAAVAITASASVVGCDHPATCANPDANPDASPDDGGGASDGGPQDGGAVIGTADCKDVPDHDACLDGLGYCQSGACVCLGCITADGVCQRGMQTGVCGVLGQVCQACGSGLACVVGDCVAPCKTPGAACAPPDGGMGICVAGGCFSTSGP